MADAAQVHSKQVAYWNGDGAARWLANNRRHHDAVRASFADLAFERADLRPGENVIEIGCGTGETSARIAEAVGPTGKVLALDVSELIGAEAAAALAALPNATAVVGDAAAWPFEPGAADVVFSQFGVMFFGDPMAAFANLRAAIKPTGRLVFICWRTHSPNVPLDIALRHLPGPAPSGYTPGPQSLTKPELIDGYLTGAGFSAPVLESLESVRDISRGRGVDGAVESVLEAGAIYRLLSEQPPDVKAAVAADLRAYFASIEADGAIIQPVWAWIVTATPE